MTLGATSATGPMCDRGVKLVLIGDSNTGKSWFASRFNTEKEPVDTGKSTIGADFVSKILCVDNGSPLSVQLWDTAGQERFKSFLPQLCRGADAALVFFDSTNEETYKSVTSWLSIVEEICDSKPCVLVANKCDLIHHCFYEKSRSTIESLSRSQGFSSFHEVSALNGMNVDETVRSAVRHVLTNRERESATSESDEKVVKLVPGDAHRKNGCAC